MAVAFAAKLRVAAAALGCSSRKEFCARLRSANPATHVDLDRLNKWMQGRSLPRAPSVYADLAAAIGTTRPGQWIAESSLEDFTAELAARTGVDIAGLVVPDGLARRGNARAAGLFGGVATLAGAFAAYSPAWSPHYRGRLLRGALRLAAGRAGALLATYGESFAGRDVRLTAEAWMAGRSMHLVMREPVGDIPLFFSLLMPGPPASVLCGVMSGFAFLSHEPLPTACRVVFIRVPDTPKLDGTNRYLDPVPGAIAADLAELGLAVAEAERLDAFTHAFVGTLPMQATPEDQTTFASMLDRQHLDLAG
ncbi:MAG: hypothetical protein JNL66_26785 [Alphaproteobacteria bacterium]|nr:hypothetical protein [Alphaproteobacteria bacterium]